MVNKKAYMRTLEAVIAIALTFIFLVIFIPEYTLTKSSEKNTNVLPSLYKNSGFRECVILKNTSCVNQSLSKPLAGYTYTFNISSNPSDQAPILPPKRVFSESAFIAGNSSTYKPAIIRLYYWGQG